MPQFAVYRVDDRNARLDEIGQVELDAENRLALLSAVPEAEADLREAIAEMNGAESLLRKTKPLPGAAKFSIRKEKSLRGEVGFFAALQDNLRRWHNMELAEP